MAQGNTLAELARYPEAILVFEEIISRYPDSDVFITALGRKADCQFMMGADDPGRYEQSIETYRIVADSRFADISEVLQVEYKIGRCLEKLGRTDESLEQYYSKVVVRYLDEMKRGIMHTERSKVWFTRAAFSAADILESRGDWRRLVNVLGRVDQAGVPAADEARDRIARVRAERWWVFH